MTVKAITKPSAAYSHSCFTHFFSVNNISVDDVNKLIARLQDTQYNGDWDSYEYMGKVMSISYETTDPWEGREEFANELGTDISNFLK
jgi:hypothetical protein